MMLTESMYRPPLGSGIPHHNPVGHTAAPQATEEVTSPSAVTEPETPATTAPPPAVTVYPDTPLSSPVSVSFEPQSASTLPAGQELAARTVEVLRQQADSPQFRELLEQVYPNATSERIDAVLEQIRTGTLPLPQVSFVPAEVLNGNLGAYSDTGRIFLNQDLQSRPVELEIVMMQEMGHHLDRLLGGGDQPGDEGLALSLGMAKGGVPLTEEELSLTRQQPDTGTITVNGETLQVEHAGPLIPVAIWTARAAAATTIDGVIGAAIGAITGVPPSWLDTAIDFGINMVAPGANQVRKTDDFLDAVNGVTEALRGLERVPGGPRLSQNIVAAKDRVLSEIGTAVTTGNLDPLKRAMSQLIGHIREAQIATRLQANGAAVEHTNRTFSRDRNNYVEVDVISSQNGQRFFDQVKSGEALDLGPGSNKWSDFTRQVDRTLEMANENGARVRYYVDSISADAREYLTQRGIEIIENGRFLAD